MRIYYNDFEPSAVAWLRELIQFGLLPEGDVDSRSIKDVKADELKGYDQCHFFAGIGGWPLALQIAGVASAKSVWTGSCPCQPFSQAGKRKGTDDERHLWPEFARLINECRPTTVFGEQVQEAVKLGWLDDVSSDLEKSGYAFGSVVLGAHSVGAPHIRQRLFWVAHAAGEGRCGRIKVEARGCEEFRRSSADFCLGSYGEHRGGGSTLAVADVCSPSYGIPGRVAQLRGLGNAIVPQVAAEFIRAAWDSIGR